MQERLDCEDRGAEARGELGMAATLELASEECLALAGGKLGDRDHQPLHPLALFGRLARRLLSCLAGIVGERAGRLSPSPGIERSVPHDLKQPRSHPLGTGALLEGTVGTQHRLLHDFLSSESIGPQHPRREAQQFGSIRNDELGEGLAVAAATLLIST